MGGSHQEFPNSVVFFFCFFLVFSKFFWFLCMGSSPKRLKVFFNVIIAWRFILCFSVYGFKWWTDNLKSRQVERVLTNFKGCEPSCRKVQKVAALVGSGGWPYIYIIHVYIIIHIIYIYVYIYIIHIIIIFFNPFQMFPQDVRESASWISKTRRISGSAAPTANIQDVQLPPGGRSPNPPG